MPPLITQHAEDDATVEEVQKILASNELTLVMACASFASKQCRPLLDRVESESFRSDHADLTGVLVIDTDSSDELEDLAVDLGMTAIPSFQVYRRGKLCGGSSDGEVATVESIEAALSSPCCAQTGTPTDAEEILKLVSKSYADTLNKNQSCCVSVDSTLNGYSAEDLLKAGAEANLGLGCGNPLSFANLEEGETVVDLGSGAGIDCFLAAERVGPNGSVIGIDMTPDMVHRARSNAKKRNGGAGNVQFRLGEIEYLPVANDTADCVISNCVINLSPDKAQVFREIYRVLKPGGRVAVSDVVTRPERVIPEELKTAEALAC